MPRHLRYCPTCDEAGNRDERKQVNELKAAINLRRRVRNKGNLR